jgi:hypothetical protein
MGKPNVIVEVDGALICSGREPMIVPTGGAHVRAAEIRIPAQFESPPAVTATVHPTTGPGTVGAVFGVFSIKINRLGTPPQAETQVAIQATNVQAGVPIEGDFVCDYVIVGLPAST